VRAERITRAIQSRSAPRRWAICIQVGSEKGDVSNAEEVLGARAGTGLRWQGVRLAESRRLRAISQTMKAPAMRLMAGWSQRIWRTQEVPGGEILRDCGEEIVRG